jgi:hypothetical protein
VVTTPCQPEVPQNNGLGKKRLRKGKKVEGDEKRMKVGKKWSKENTRTGRREVKTETMKQAAKE